jgi:hypothetical protein
VSLIDADLDADAGTMQRDESYYVLIKLCNEITPYGFSRDHKIAKCQGLLPCCSEIWERG